MKQFVAFAFLALFFVSPVFSYDQKLAGSYEQYFSSFSGKDTGKALQMIPANVFVESLKKGEKLFIVDVRTPGETGVYGFHLANSVAIPMNEIFKPSNLAKIPTDQKVVIVCKSGNRAMAVATGLRHIGFSNVFVLKGGFSGVAGHLSPMNIY